MLFESRPGCNEATRCFARASSKLDVEWRYDCKLGLLRARIAGTTCLTISKDTDERYSVSEGFSMAYPADPRE